MATIADRYCQMHGIPPEKFVRHAMVRSLTWQGRLLYPLLRLSPEFFACDAEFVREVGRASSLDDFPIDSADYKLHPDNARPFRRLCRIRVSSRKLRRHLAAVFESEEPENLAKPARA